MKMQTVAAAIATVADKVIDQRKVKASDGDGMALAMQEAERIVANELARDGMCMQEALALASEASMKHAPETAESSALANSAINREHDPVPVAANDDPGAAARRAGAEDPSTQEDAIAGAGASTDAHGSQAAPVDQGGSHSAPIPGATPKPSPTMVEAPAVIRGAAVEIPRIGFNVEMKPVSDVFKGVDANEKLFNFKVPYITWDSAHPGVPEIDTAYNMGLADLLTMLYAVVERRTVNLVGPHGCGKTEFVAQVAARLRFPLSVLPMDGQLSRSEMIGRERIRATAHGNETYFSPGLLARALLEPGFILLDEVDRGVSDVQYACHSIYLQQGLKILEDGGRTIPMHDHNRVFATANTKGRGSADGMYLATEDMSEATRDRFPIWIEMDYQDAEEDATVLRAKVPDLAASTAKLIADVAESIREDFNQQKLSQTCSMRQQLDVARMATFLTKLERDDAKRDRLIGMAFNRVILGRASPEDKGAIATLIEARLPNAFSGDPVI